MFRFPSSLEAINKRWKSLYLPFQFDPYQALLSSCSCYPSSWFLVFLIDLQNWKNSSASSGSWFPMMSGNSNPLAGVKPTSVDSLPRHHVHHMSADHHALPVVALPANVGDAYAIGGGNGELIAAADAQAWQQFEEADCSSGSNRMEEQGIGVVENEEMEAERPPGPNHLGDTPAAVPAQAGRNQLTLSFQDAVYVFDSVSVDKVIFFLYLFVSLAVVQKAVFEVKKIPLFTLLFQIVG